MHVRQPREERQNRLGREREVILPQTDFEVPSKAAHRRALRSGRSRLALVPQLTAGNPESAWPQHKPGTDAKGQPVEVTVSMLSTGRLRAISLTTSGKESQ